MEIYSQIIGWIGTILIVLAYLLVSLKKIDSAGKVYQTMNLLGAIGVGVNVYYQHAWPSVALQAIWGIIAISSLLRTKK